MLRTEYSMKQNEIFADAKWICAGEYSHEGASKADERGVPHFPIIRSHFDLKKVKKATLYVIGLGFFYCYINGKRISEDAFLPLYTDYEPKDDYPKDEVVTGHRIYVPHYDVTDLLTEGENVLAIHYGGGWYVRETFFYRDPNYGFGSAKAIYRLEVETEDGKYDIVSSENDLVGDSYVKTYVISAYENHDYNGFDDSCFEKDYDDSAWKKVMLAKPLDTEYMFTECPADRIHEELSPVFTVETDGMRCYDSGRNCAQIPVLKLKGQKGDVVTVEFAEEKNPDGSPDMQFHYGQKVSFVCDGKERIVRPMFTWFAYRYFRVSGNAEVVCTKVIHTDVKVNSYFDCDNETLNWLYKAFLNTQLSNMHLGVPSDCPHIERRGYTGDGQLVCHSAMST
ncbi:MAG: family 78 glycoside hydrolase catalytic domain, partial [Clostridia bacterium]|nr:family 78 glycoside hydrolase catalytic domain [Clostridia bacterium]